MSDPTAMVLIGGAALLGGAVNALAGGGSLITFPTLLAAGLPPVTANVTNTLALCPGYFGASLAQRRDLVGQGRRAALLLPIAAACGVAGALILLRTGERAFQQLVPFLILGAALLVAIQEPVRAWLLRRPGRQRPEVLAALPIAAAAVYGGYFGAGMGVMLLAALGIAVADSLLRLNALKQLISLVVNVAAAVVFVVLGPVDWAVVLVMAVGALAGGALGGALASRVPATLLRWCIVGVGVIVSAVYFVKM
jgi:uncharacterized membrane protein YfcA